MIKYLLKPNRTWLNKGFWKKSMTSHLILITTSTLARTHKDILIEEGVCSHFEIIELPGARIAEMTQVVTPMVEFLARYDKVQVLCV